MRSVPVAVTWEILRKGNWHFAVGFLGGNLIPIMIFGILQRCDVDFRDPALMATHSAFLLVSLFIYSAVAIQAIGSPSRLYHMPVSASMLVAWHLIPAVSIVALEMLLSMALQNALFDLQLPVWSPILFSMTAISLFMATYWFTEKSEWMPVAEGLLTIGLGIWFHCRFSSLNHWLNRLWIASIPGEVCMLIIALIASFVLGRIGIARNRCGERLKPWGIVAWITRLLDATPQQTRVFRSAEEAHGWYEWSLKGWALPLSVVLGLAGQFSIWILFNRIPGTLIEWIMAGGALLIPMVGVIWAILIGNVGPMESNFEMRSFLASRPMTSKTMAWTILKTTAKSIFLSWSLWVGALSLVIAVLQISGNTPRPLFPNDFSWIIFPLTLFGSWTLVAVLASFGMTGRPVLVAQFFCIVAASHLGIAGFSGFVLSPDSQRWLWAGLAALWSIAFILGTLYSFIAAHRQNLIERRALIGSGGVWILLCALGIAIWVRFPTTPLINCFVFTGFAALAVAPLATAPLALAWNRTR